MLSAQQDMTQLLQQWHDGDKQALDRLIPLVVGELRRIANAYFVKEAPGHTLQPTAVVNEVYLRLVGAGGINWQSRAQFFRIAAKLMRRVLVDHARGRDAAKRWGGVQRATLDVDRIVPDGREVDLVALDEALSEMSRINPEGSRIVELRYFIGLTLEEIAELLGVSRTTAKRRWRGARIWLHHELGRQGLAGGDLAGGDGH